MREGRHQGDRGHQHGDDARVTPTGETRDETPESLGDAGAIERCAQHEDAGHHDGRLAGEAGESLPRFEQSGSHQGEDDHDGHHIVADALCREEYESAEEDGEEEQVLRGQPAGHDDSLSTGHASHPRHARRLAWDTQRRRRAPRKELPVLWTLFVMLLVLWALGVVSSYTLNGFIHI